MRLLYGRRAWVVGIHVDTDGVTVAGFLVSRRVAWNDIDHFAVLSLGDYPWVGHMVLRDGRKLDTYASARPVAHNVTAIGFKSKNLWTNGTRPWSNGAPRTP